jgi:hypothetical protein
MPKQHDIQLNGRMTNIAEVALIQEYHQATNGQVSPCNQ